MSSDKAYALSSLSYQTDLSGQQAVKESPMINLYSQFGQIDNTEGRTLSLLGWDARSVSNKPNTAVNGLCA